jgi:hypothetical protein
MFVDNQKQLISVSYYFIISSVFYILYKEERYDQFENDKTYQSYHYQLLFVLIIFGYIKTILLFFCF